MANTLILFAERKANINVFLKIPQLQQLKRLVYSRISHEYSSLFIIAINLIFMFSLRCMD